MKSKLEDQLNCAAVLDHLCADLYHYVVENLEDLRLFAAINIDDSCLFLLRRGFNDDLASHGRIDGKQPLNAELFYHNVGATLSNAHDAGALAALLAADALQALKVEVSVELHACCACELSHAILAVHLITLLRHLELVSHVV